MPENMHGDVPGDLNRRTFLNSGMAAAGVWTFGLAGRALELPKVRPARHCIWVMLTGAPGHLDTWDPKPSAPAEVRGPFRPIATCVPGLEICEHFPHLARLADRLSLVRGMNHPGPALHETGWRYALTGGDFDPPQARPYAGSLLSRHRLPIGDGPASVILPGRYVELGKNRWTGEFAAELGARHQPWAPDEHLLTGPTTSARLAKAMHLAGEPVAMRDRYGRHELGESCLRARRLVEAGIGWTQINHFRSISSGLSWDMHAGSQRLGTNFDDYAQVLCPQLDQALSALLIDLESRGLLAETVVAVVAEMGRSPRLNERGGREHHTAAWTNLLTGGPIVGGRIVGTTDRLGAEVIDRPTSPGEFLTSVMHALGLAPHEANLRGAQPINELFS